MKIRSVADEDLVESWSYHWDVVDVHELKLFERFEDGFDSIF